MPEGRKDDTVQLRLTAAQKRLFREAAEVDGVGLSEWIRRQAMLRASEILVRSTASRA